MTHFLAEELLSQLGFLLLAQGGDLTRKHWTPLTQRATNRSNRFEEGCATADSLPPVGQYVPPRTLWRRPVPADVPTACSLASGIRVVHNNKLTRVTSSFACVRRRVCNPLGTSRHPSSPSSKLVESRRRYCCSLADRLASSRTHSTRCDFWNFSSRGAATMPIKMASLQGSNLAAIGP
jgi:hypothetical protein